MSLGKWIAGGLGWAFFGPIGGIVGFLVGTAFEVSDSPKLTSGQTGPTVTTRGDFMVSLLVLTAAVMKVDGNVKKAELDFVKQYLLRAFGKDAATDAIRMLRDIVKQEIPVQEVSRQIGQNLDYSSKLQLLHYLFGISSADGQTHRSEVELIQMISSYMSINPSDFNSIKSMFYSDTQVAYSILGVTPESSDEEIKKAYRKMAVEYHPDKVAYLGDDVQHTAKEKFQKINEAYESIKKQRGFA
ncbi:MAG TPA: molecular chaperone DjlA [Marinilabiliales bacterium]|nr:MAG: hypothetical protein A2W96_08350 [Bacteroidetes bacterium GWD2_40_43]OFX93972.1 MAG: hypothetical protein A2W97_14275 [Bacteroidetes bacterium GWE2_40_63]OFY19761.1 MAG: hypothetical protein A2W88_03145 [Bacteroidetes bacterium GWF2_40_13]OFZ24519.1 MAG: hypothetical protein A2437_01240 [Bacteroidetes bacterium RIFOXYC2_FULL_40_12]HAN00099.1 molecular chaperone DjlA [Marinilabiliales bacterium]